MRANASFRDHPGSLIRTVRDEIFTHPKGVDDGSSSEHVSDLVYGEFGFNAVLFRKYSHQIPRRAVVADLGSGVGRPLFAAACLRPDLASRCVGVEKLPELHEPRGRAQGSVRRGAGAGSNPSPAAGGAAPRGLSGRRGVEGRRRRFGKQRPSSATSCSTRRRRSRGAASLTPGASVVTLRRGFRDCGHEGACWELLEATERRQSWGMSTVYVHRRTQNSPRRTGIED